MIIFKELFISIYVDFVYLGETTYYTYTWLFNGSGYECYNSSMATPSLRSSWNCLEEEFLEDIITFLLASAIFFILNLRIHPFLFCSHCGLKQLKSFLWNFYFSGNGSPWIM
ncbi:MAG: hypothetical protein LIO93_04805 [Bacteroidales bacterium]|nr:hypothetical protein [Bacteroidales bacterium]